MKILAVCLLALAITGCQSDEDYLVELLDLKLNLVKIQKELDRLKETNDNDAYAKVRTIINERLSDQHLSKEDYDFIMRTIKGSNKTDDDYPIINKEKMLIDEFQKNLNS